MKTNMIKFLFGSSAVMRNINIMIVKIAKNMITGILLLLTGCIAREDNSSIISHQASVDFQCEKYTGAFQQLFPLAQQGNAQAQYSIGYMYYYGLGVEEDPSQARYWIYRAARNGNLHAVKALEIEKFPNAGL